MTQKTAAAKTTLEIEDTNDGGVKITLTHWPAPDATSKAQAIGADLLKLLGKVSRGEIARTPPQDSGSSK
jgi:hypothetical protein